MKITAPASVRCVLQLMSRKTRTAMSVAVFVPECSDRIAHRLGCRRPHCARRCPFEQRIARQRGRRGSGPSRECCSLMRSIVNGHLKIGQRIDGRPRSGMLGSEARSPPSTEEGGEVDQKVRLHGRPLESQTGPIVIDRMGTWG